MSLEKQTLETVPYRKTNPLEANLLTFHQKRPITSEKLFPRPISAVEHETQRQKSVSPRNRCNATTFRKFQCFKVKTQCRRDKHEADGQYSCHRVACCVHMKSRSIRSPLDASHRYLGRKCASVVVICAQCRQLLFWSS